MQKLKGKKERVCEMSNIWTKKKIYRKNLDACFFKFLLIWISYSERKKFLYIRKCQNSVGAVICSRVHANSGLCRMQAEAMAVWCWNVLHVCMQIWPSFLTKYFVTEQLVLASLILFRKVSYSNLWWQTIYRQRYYLCPQISRLNTHQHKLITSSWVLFLKFKGPFDS